MSGKRQVKAPKIYFRDSGLLHNLLNIPDYHSLTGNPRLGASWEGFAMEQVLQALHPTEAYLWIVYPGNEEYPVTDKIMVRPLTFMNQIH
ncbi:MAG: DUF4143 domain-containing protein [Mariprofundaceae bacterium]|nr:DUF4143 domain-containing protein [Mariprofundaceae bacterium]